MRPTFDDLKAIWLLCYSRSAFNEAREWLDKLETAQAASGYEALTSSPDQVSAEKQNGVERRALTADPRSSAHMGASGEALHEN